MSARHHRSTADDLVVRALLARDQRSAAMEAVLAAYGAEVFGFLVGVLESRRLADQVYADVLASAVLGMEHFDRRHSVRVWLYGVARRALREHRRRIAAYESTRTDELRPVVAAVRHSLTAEERELLILRVDRGMDWQQLAFVELGSDAPLQEIQAAADRMSARFAEVVARVRAVTKLARRRR